MATRTRATALWIWVLGVVPALVGAAFLGASCGPRPSDHAVELMGEDCASCHMPEFKAAVSPVHEGVFPTTCGACHTNDAWHPAINGDHPWFPLRNVHSAVPCASCHVGDPPVYAGTPNQCVGCHAEDFDQAQSPPHVGLNGAHGLSTECAACHTDEHAGWKPAPLYQHQWPLRGTHANTDCVSCHDNPPTYDTTSNRCVDCHADDRAQATNPSHEGFSDDCASCHTDNDTDWRPAMFDHEWPLTGKHATTTCASCHGDPPTYTGTPTTCIGCHADDRAQATNPSHDGFSTDCASCHTTSGWQPAMFDHQWPLTGKHATATCASCHGDPPTYTGTATACVGCHQDDYNNSPYPGHDAFPTTCSDCHTTNGWSPATGGHPENKFPTSGRHNYTCNQCHNPALGPNGRGNADCVGCHTGEHTRQRMDAEHREESGYPTGSAPPNFCLDCHPRG